MTDPRDSLFTELHSQFLKPIGFRKKGRRSQWVTSNDLLLSVVLESAPSYPLGPTRFGFDLRATHPSLPSNRLLINVGLSSFAQGIQHWTIDYGASTDELFSRIKEVFATTGMELLQRMSTTAGLVGLYEQLDSAWYYQSHTWCLDMLGRSAEAEAVIQRAIYLAPHERFREHAQHALAARANRRGA